MKVAVLVSGGVDSSVALLKLKEQGVDVHAFYIKIWLEEDFKQCPWREDLKFVNEVVEKLNVPLKVVNLQRDYWSRILEYTLSRLKAGDTPNPDIMCNREIKFGIFEEKYGKDFEKIATGHYARLLYSKPLKRNLLMQAKDTTKDQTYFLSRMTNKQLSRALFPLGNYLKSEVRGVAKKAGLPTYSRPDSQGLCFLGKIRFSDFVSRYLGEKEGEIIDIDTGEVVGVHRGYWFYTIGQRSGLGIGGSKQPFYVARKDKTKNVIYVASGRENQMLMKRNIKLRGLNVLAEELLQLKEEYLVKLRHPHIGIPGKLVSLEGNSLRLRLNRSAFGVTRGQFGVLYKDKVVVCSGEIV